MADALSQTSLFSACNHDKLHHNHQNQRSSLHVFPKGRVYFRCKSFPSTKLKSQTLSGDFHGERIVSGDNDSNNNTGMSRREKSQFSIKAQTRLGIGNSQKWWQKGLQANMKEVKSAQDLVDSLLNAGDKLVVVDFFSPGCGGCKALHPKISQFAEMNPEVLFLQVNYEEHKSMCYSLGVHVLPFFRFYRGAHGRLCSFSCTNATIKKFKDALAKHTPDRCSLGPTKGLEEKELLALAANRELSFNYTPKPVQPEIIPAQKQIVPETSPSHSNSSLPLPMTDLKRALKSEEKPLVSSGR
ncbi:thioredoxin-like 1-1, chloroplastic [Carica papaya]|uniref:thioredoxin-like 1-1, chloroplastic n=1 Tax=Carica papaya TaxID=3649 RepID=UPI000B8D13C2|nr:thioredoxin-like 1-1, chloroplastic [Carica papaya]